MVFALVVLASLQLDAATLAGRVVDDATGAPIPGALVVLSDLGRGTTTDAQGRYRVDRLPAGPQHVAVRSVGYERRTLHALLPRAGTLELDVRLTAAPIEIAPLAVAIGVPVRDIDSGRTVQGDRGLTRAQMYHHPQLAEPDPFDALRGGAVHVAAENPSGVHLRGGAADQTAFTVDGIPVINPFHSAVLFSAWNPDALDRVDVRSAAPPSGSPGSLSGVIDARTRAPASAPAGQGSVGTSQTRAVLEGGLGDQASWLASARAGYPSALAPDEQSYLRGSSLDGLARVDMPLAGGRARLLAYASDDHIDVAATSTASAPRNEFDWDNASVGAIWSVASTARSAIEARVWLARGGARALWKAATAAPVRLSSERTDVGALLQLERGSADANLIAGVRLDHIRTLYRVRGDSLPGGGRSLAATTPVATAFSDWSRTLGSVRVGAGLAISWAGDRLHPGPRATLEWHVRDGVDLHASIAQLHQFASSLRNAESVVGRVFPAELYVAADAAVPVGRSRNAVVGVALEPGPGVRLAAQAWTRRFDDIVLVAPVAGQPFATGPFVIGSGASSGVAADVAVSTRRIGAMGSWVWQTVRLRHETGDYEPHHGARHVLDGGVIVFPTATLSLRVGISAAFGRRGAIFDGFEWESCNLLDEGCEFGGTPEYSGDPGSVALPGYARLDFGFRKHWHANIHGRDATLAVFGTASNLLGRANVLARVTDESGERRFVTMRPFSPVAVGVDWRF